MAEDMTTEKPETKPNARQQGPLEGMPAGLLLGDGEAFQEDEERLQKAVLKRMKEEQEKAAAAAAAAKAEDEEQERKDADEAAKAALKNAEAGGEAGMAAAADPGDEDGATFPHSLAWYICQINEIKLDENILAPLQGGPCKIIDVLNDADDQNKPVAVMFMQPDGSQYQVTKSRVHMMQADITPEQAHNLTLLASLNPLMKEKGVIPTGPLKTQAMLIVAANFHGLKVAQVTSEIPEELLREAEREFMDYVNNGPRVSPAAPPEAAVAPVAAAAPEADPAKATVPEAAKAGESVVAPEEQETAEDKAEGKTEAENAAEEAQQAAEPPEYVARDQQAIDDLAEAINDIKNPGGAKTEAAADAPAATETNEAAASDTPADTATAPAQEASIASEAAPTPAPAPAMERGDKAVSEAAENILKAKGVTADQFNKAAQYVAEKQAYSRKRIQDLLGVGAEKADAIRNALVAAGALEKKEDGRYYPVTAAEATATAETTVESDAAPVPADESKPADTNEAESALIIKFDSDPARELSETSQKLLGAHGLTTDQFNKAAQYVAEKQAYSRKRMQALLGVGAEKADALRNAMMAEGLLAKGEDGRYFPLVKQDGESKAETEIAQKRAGAAAKKPG